MRGDEMRREKGFTLIEALVVLVIGVIIAGGLMFMLSGSRRTSRIAEIDAQSQQNARVSIDMMVRDLRSNGYGIDVGQGQLTLVNAGPYDVIFNANIAPEPDQDATPGYPAAINVGAYPSTVPPGGALYSPPRTYDTGDETITGAGQRQAVLLRLEETGHEVISIDRRQMRSFLGNCLQLEATDGSRVIAMSRQAEDALTPAQTTRLRRHGRIVSSPIHDIERSAGGSVRCMLAEVHLPERVSGEGLSA